MADEIADAKDMTRILVVDDDNIGLLLATILRRHGYEKTDYKQSGMDGLSSMGITETHTAGSEQTPPYDVVLLDIILPDINGFEICQRIREVWGDQVVVILITGFDIEQQHARFIESGADDFLMKPVNSQELLNRIKLHLGKLSQRRGHARFTISSDLEIRSIGGYRVTKTLSWSGSVVVYLAERRGEKAVIKILTKQAMEYSDVLERFQREGELLRSFDHPNVIKLKSSGSHHGLPYLVTEYIEGKNLEDFAIDTLKPPFETVANISLAIARGLEHVHLKGVIHRDVKLKNTFIRDDGCVKIGDFGIALTKQSPRLTQPGYAIGTPIYMAPEQFKGENVSYKVDLYAFGASVYHLTTGLPPFTAGTAMELLRKHANCSPRPMAEARDDIPEKWDALIVEKCMAKNPVNRPDSMTDIVKEIEAIMFKEGIEFKQETPETMHSINTSNS